jgi:hypothetical protein
MRTSRHPSRRSVQLEIASTWDGDPIPAGERVRLRLRLTPSTLRIAVDAPFHGDPPPPGAPGPTDRLWEHEVVELFVAAAGHDDDTVPYTEIEISPFGHHLVLRLRGVRRVVESELPLALRTWRRDGRWLAVARLDRRLLPPPPWQVDAFAIHGEGDARRHLAATPLPGPRPDFHQPRRFPAFDLGRGE